MVDHKRFSSSRKEFRHILALSALLTLLSACSSTQWLYRNADWFIERYAIKSLDANEAQLQAWRPELERVLQRHLAAETPILDNYLELIARFAEDPSNETVNAACLVRGANLLFTRHAELAADLAIPLLAVLEPGQIRHLADYLEQRRSHLRQRYLSGDEKQQRQARSDRISERFERWTGPLDAAQKARIQAFAESLPDITTAWLAHRARQEARLLQLLREGADAERLHAHLLGWWLPWTGDASPGLAQQWEKAEAGFIMLLDELAASLTQQQREKVHDRVSGLRSDLAALHGKIPRAVAGTTLELPCQRQRS